MFVDFNRVFNGKPQTELKIPDAMIEHLNMSLPQGVKYRATENGNCEIVSDGGSVTLGGFSFVPSEEQKRILGKKFTIEDVLSYSYNAQKAIPLQLKKEGYIILNGEEFPIERLHYNPYCPVTCISGEMFMYPQTFPDAFPLWVGCAKYSRQLTFKRVPNESIHIAAFESEGETPLSVHFFVDQVKSTIQFNISFNLSYAKNIRDIVESTSIYNAFVDGEGLFCGQPLITDIDTSKVKKYNPDSVLFWEKVLLIESALGVRFMPPNEDVDFDAICEIEILYQNLINNVPIRMERKIESIEGDWCANNIELIKDSIGKSVCIEMNIDMNISLFKAVFNMPTIVCIFNAQIKDYIKKGNKNIVLLEDESTEKKMYTSEMRFSNEKQLKEYEKIEHHTRINAFSDAKLVKDYLK